MRHAPSTIFERIAGPDAGIGIIKTVTVAIEISLLPGQVTLQQRPHRTHISRITCPVDVRQQLVDEDEVHVIVVRPEITAGIPTDIPAAKKRSAHTLQLTGNVQSSIRNDGSVGRSCQLRKRIAGKMLSCPVMPTQRVRRIGPPPTGKTLAPGDG